MAGKWLFKTEPSDYSFEDLVRDGRTRWEGVANPAARLHLRSVRRGDPILIYHTANVRAVIGLARAVSDPEDAIVEIAAERPLARPVTLEEIKKHPRFKSFDLVRNSRLSVMPVPDAVWAELIRLSATRTSKEG